MDFRDLRNVGFDSPIFSILEDMMLDNTPEAREKGGTGGGRNKPSRAYVPDAKAMVAAPADVIEYPNAYLFIVDMPGIRVTEIQVQLENDNVLVVSGERKHKKEKDEKEGVKYLRKERRVGKFMTKFQLPENANTEAISAVTQDRVLMVTVKKLRPPKGKTIQVNGVLTLTVKKLPPPEPKKGVTVKKLPPLEPKKVKTIQVKVA